jgi:hypothetical protein
MAGGAYRVQHQFDSMDEPVRETAMTTPKMHHAPRRKKRPAPARAATQNSAPANSDSFASPAATFIEPERRNAMISDAAYFLSEQRDFCPGHELDDWLAAEREIDHVLASGQPGTGCGI